MDVRVVNEDPLARTPAPGSGGRRRAQWVWWVAGGLTLVLVVCLVIVAVHPGRVGSPVGPVSTPVPSPTGPVSPSVTAGAPGVGAWAAAGDAWREGMGVPVVGVMATGLPMCGVPYKGWTVTHDGVGVEFPHTVAGAVGFAGQVAQWFYSMGYVVDADRHTLTPLLFLPDAVPPESVAVSTQKSWGVDGTGRPLVGAEKGLVAWFDAYPEYGAFKVNYVNRAGHAPTGTGDIQEVDVSWFLPVVNGIDSRDTTTWDHVATWFVVQTVTVTWTSSGWRTAMVTRDLSVPGSDASRDTLPHQQTNLGYDTLAALLGGGWCVPVDGTQYGDPTRVHSRV